MRSPLSMLMAAGTLSLILWADQPRWMKAGRLQTKTRVAAVVCRDGAVFPQRTPQGYPINYFVDPCRMHGGRR